MFDQARFIWLAAILFCGAAAVSQVRAAAAEEVSRQQVAELQNRLRPLIGQLDEIGEMHAAAERRPLIARHWQAVQAWLRQEQSMLPAPSRGELLPALFGSAGACGLPRGIEADAYVSRMRDVLWTMRERLADAYAAQTGEVRTRLLLQQVRGSYQGLALVRGFGWTGGGATPAPPATEPVADSASEPAYLVRHYCGQCHAAPPAELHSANEWSTVAARMVEHLRLANASNPQAVEQPPARDLSVVVTYLEANACEVDSAPGI